MMSRSHLAFPGIVLAALVTLTASGCATAPPNTLEAQQSAMVRRLASQCYWHQDGFRVIYGGLQVYTACREWAHRQVRVSMPGG